MIWFRAPGFPRWELVACGVGLAFAAGPRAKAESFAPIVFFPPNPPVHGAAIEDRPASAARLYGGRRLTTPDGLADFAGETFYPALSTRLFSLELSGTLEARVQEYRAKRGQQVSALLDKFVELHDAASDERERVLRAFAATQTPQLVALEAEAERLREALVASGTSESVDWNADRRWKLPAMLARNDWAAKEAEFQVTRATAFYQKGLIPQQRGLLRELAMELQPLARRARGQPASRTDTDAIFFSPETTRLRLPVDASPELREKIGLYNGRKAALKRELHEAVIANESLSAAKRAEAFEALAARQWPHFGVLEQLAEEIRSEFATRPAIVPASPPWLPAALLNEIKAYNEDRDSYFGEMKYRADNAAASVPRPNLDVRSDERIQRQRDHIARQAEARRRAAVEFQEEHLTRYNVLAQRYKTIRELLATIAEKQTDRKTGRPLDADTLLRQHVISMEEYDAFGRESAIYANYRLAMLQPGLSPEQRRLLFNYALTGLAQPLPNGELMPRRSAKQPYPSW